jgi:drug/metabolite transporter (DMT)-like permease
MLAALLLVLIANALARHLAGRYPVGEVLFLRYLCALPVVLIGAAPDGRTMFATARLGLHALRAALGVGAAAAIYAASLHLPFSDLVAISYSAPLFVAVYSWPLLGERVSRWRGCLIAGGFVGVGLVVHPTHFELWSLGAVVMAVLNAFVAIAARGLARTERPATMAVWFTAFGTIFSAPLVGFGFVMPEAGDVLLFTAFGVAAGVSTHLNVRAYRHAPAAVLVPIDYFAVLLSAAIGFIVWSEIPSLAMICGGALIVATGLLQLRAAQAEAGGSIMLRDKAVPSVAGVDALTALNSTRR